MKVNLIVTCVLILTSFASFSKSTASKNRINSFFARTRSSNGRRRHKRSLKARKNKHLPKKEDLSRFSFKSTKEEMRLSNETAAAQADQHSVYQGWVTVQSKEIQSRERFPFISGSVLNDLSFPYSKDYELINAKWAPNQNKISSKFSLFMRLLPPYLVIANDDQQVAPLASLNLKAGVSVEDLKMKENCFKYKEKDAMGGGLWKFCAEDEKALHKWICYIQAALNEKEFSICERSISLELPKPQKVVHEQIIQPYIVIPIPQQPCNANWDYGQNGQDWQCMCKTGSEQSPIDLPEAEKAVEGPARPIFDYKFIPPKHAESRADGRARAGAPVYIEHFENSLRIFHQNMGRVVTMDGTVYLATDIVFHTPSEHTINGVKFAMEIQIIHVAMTKGDYGKKLILSFLVKGKAGATNRFIEELDFFSLPNPRQQRRPIYNKFYIPNLLLSTEDEELSVMEPFSFFTYQGSLTEPPCSENVIHYVASEPIEVGTTAIELFQEALREPDMQDEKGNIYLAKEKSLDNTRAIQPLNGRAVFHFNHRRYNCPSFKRVKEPERAEQGHYEKQITSGFEYVFVDGAEPSGVPGALVVSDSEALGQ